MAKSHPNNYLKQYDAESLPELEDCIIRVGDNIRLTSKGIKRYGLRLLKAGFDIRSLKSEDQLKAALEASIHIEMEEFVDLLKDNPGDPLEKSYLAAIALGDQKEMARLIELIVKKNNLPMGIRLISC